ncbi:MAG: hypothetical protein KGY70_07340 [Bacteroidales bacterium]|nr:hypothetical protein [Bacteroidales bacterium]MBS3774982.1 hypothetical protein [Bacteroidales bacterium]
MKNILKYIFLLLILLATSTPEARTQEEKIKGPRIGVDVSGFAWQYFVPSRKNIGITGDFEINPKYYATAEAGRLETDRKEATHHYLSNGYYGKIGFDRNFLEPQPLSRYDMLYAGFRLGGATLSHQAESIVLSNEYWGDYTESIPSHRINSFWAEVVGGIKTEVFKNFFMGWSIRGQLMLFRQKGTEMKPWLIPGYGSPESNTSIFITYSLSYRIPLLRISKNQ